MLHNDALLRLDKVTVPSVSNSWTIFRTQTMLQCCLCTNCQFTAAGKKTKQKLS